MTLRTSATFLLAFVPVIFGQTIPGRYIVELNTEPVAEHVSKISNKALHKAAAAAHRSRIRTEQDSARAKIEARKATVIDTVDTVANALIVQLPDGASPAALQSLGEVKRIHPVRLVKPLLDRAVAIHKVTDVWNQVGLANAGAGIKVAVIDTGIELGHPAFQDSTFQAPPGFPVSDSFADNPFTSNKVIVARSYVKFLPSRDPDGTARDHVGHGTAIASIIAGGPAQGPLANITGIAPRAWLGNYKVFGTPGYNDNASSDAILKAIDDAVADGMDIINLSLGSDVAPRFDQDVFVDAVERAAKAGVIVVCAAGNNGSDLNTVSSPATAPSAIAAGATTNDRTFAPNVDVPGVGANFAIAGSGPVPSSAITGPVSVVANLDGNGLACNSLPGGSLNGRVALILRGTCTFETKLINVQRAGAIAGVVYASAASPDPIPMNVGTATLPAVMVSNDAGVAIANAASQGSATATVHFDPSFAAIAANRITDFSAAGPNVDLSIKPDVMAVGDPVYMATQTYDFNGDMYDRSGYTLQSGTSFSSPMVAGVAALIKSARPGLTVAQYRSLIINSAAPMFAADGSTPLVQRTGAGLLDASAAFRSKLVLNPVSVSFGTDSATQPATLTLTNLGTAADTFTVSASPVHGALTPSIDNSVVTLDPGGSAQLQLTWNAGAPAPGTYDGFLTITSNSDGSTVRAPYWFAVAGTQPAAVTLLDSITSARRGTVQTDAIDFRVTEASGLPLGSGTFTVTAVSGGGSVRAVNSQNDQVPGLFSVDVVMGPVPGDNVFRITAGAYSIDVTITGK